MPPSRISLYMIHKMSVCRTEEHGKRKKPAEAGCAFAVRGGLDLFDFDKMLDLEDHAADNRRVLEFGLAAPLTLEGTRYA